MRPRTRFQRAFTLIEMVIALALAVVMVVAVQSATVSLAGVAGRQKALAADEARWLRFEDLLRRDLRGWKSGKAGSDSQPGKDDSLLFEVETTADALTAWGSGKTEAQRTSKVRYVVRTAAGQFVLARAEGEKEQDAGMALVQSPERPKVEFLQADGSWATRVAGSTRPRALRLTINARTMVIRL
ncbi:MAG: prepilin-type N-terminal cleavage/methylation domain-containing protein [Planctomycetes bacterium]|nr:prepilin-type N-terminal cleavage/methylation domain-containing protein [Planctomycetota bacterium]